MKFKKLLFLVFLNGLLLNACNRDKKVIKYAVNVYQLVANWDVWYSYTYKNVDFNRNFIGYDQDSSVVSKNKFLNILLEGRSISILVATVNRVPVYKIVQLRYHPTNQSMTDVVKQRSSHELFNVSLEGKWFPDFQMNDISGKNYTKKDFQQKVTVVKNWFIGCQRCLEEFESNNQLSRKLKGKVQFLSFALDSESKLIKFLQKKPLAFPTIPDQSARLVDTLHFSSYPSYLILDPMGKIIRVLDSIENVQLYLSENLQIN